MRKRMFDIFNRYISVNGHWALESNNRPPGEGNILRLGHLGWNNPDEDRKNANSVFKRCFHRLRRPWILRSPVLKGGKTGNARGISVNSKK